MAAPLRLLVLLLLAPPILLLPGPGGVEAADEDVQRWVDVLEDRRIARNPFEQRQREEAIRELGKIGTKKAAAALLPVFEDPFVHLHDHAVSAWIQMVKGKHGSEAQTWLTQRGLLNRQPHVRRAVVITLGLTSGREIEEPLRVAILKEKDGSVLEALAMAAVRLRTPPTLKGALLKRLTHKDGAAVFAITQAVAALDGTAAVKPLLKTLKHRSPIARAGALLALQTLDALPPKRIEAALADKDPAPAMALAETLELRTKVLPWPQEGKPLLQRLLAHPSWRVRAAAVQGALRVWSNEIVDALIERLDKEPGRLHDDVRRALETYTGKAIGDDPDLWRGWWIRNHSGFDAGERPETDRAGNIPFREAGAGADEGASKTVAFFNLPIRSKRLAFVFDPSGSMRDPAGVADDAEMTKFQLLQQEVEKTLRKIPKDTVFDLYLYRYWSEYPPLTKLTRAFGKRSPATKSNVAKAIRWLAHPNQAPKGWADLYDPLAALFEEDVDTVVLVSDGRPSRGRFDRDFRILQEFPRANRFRRMAVHTILVGTKRPDRKFMQALAAATGGRFQEAGGR